MNIIFSGTIEKGYGQPVKFIPDEAFGFQAHLQSLHGKGPVEAIVRKRKKTRTDDQNRYYWGVVVALIAEYCGYEPDEAHDALRRRFLTSHSGRDSLLPTIRSTTSLDTKEMTEYIEQCRRLGAEMGIRIPSPNEVEL